MQDLQRAGAAIDRVGKILAIQSSLRTSGGSGEDAPEGTAVQGGTAVPGGTSTPGTAVAPGTPGETMALPQGALAVEFEKVSFGL